MHDHVAEEQPQIGEFLPLIADILPSSEPFPCTTSSWDSGIRKFSEKHTDAEGQLVVWNFRWIGSLEK